MPSAAAITSTNAGELPSWDVPLDQAVIRLQALADAGNVLAQRDLASRLKICTRPSQRAAAESDERDRESIEEDQQNEKLDNELRATRVANAQRRIDRNATYREACAKLPTDLLVHWLDSMDQAAQSGDTDAMIDYARMAVLDYDSVESIVADVDEAIARRDKARAYLMKALELGDPNSLPELAEAYSDSRIDTPRLFAADAFQAYVYAYAGTLAVDPRRTQNLEWIMSQSARSLDARRLADAQARGRRVYDQCCSR